MWYFAAAGDVHGHMKRMLYLLQGMEAARGISLKFVLQVGDFEPHRHEADLATMDAPAKYRELGDFPDFHRGWVNFPWPLYFIGGNHEPYGYLDQNPQGFELIPNCHYLGRMGAMNLDSLSILGLSGIYSETRSSQERPDPNQFGQVSNKAYNNFLDEEVDALSDHGHCDILMLHDWPSDVVAPADRAQFEGGRRALDYRDVGNQSARLLMDVLEPGLVLCGHMHKRYRNTILTPTGKSIRVVCLDQILAGPNAIAIFSVDDDGTISEIV